MQADLKVRLYVPMVCESVEAHLQVQSAEAHPQVHP